MNSVIRVQTLMDGKKFAEFEFTKKNDDKS